MMDHIYMVRILNFPPDPACRAFAFILEEFVLAQSLMVSFTALNAFIMVVLGKKLGLGSYDWKLLFVAFGTPALFGSICEAFKLLGPSGAW